jgi:redox-sensing transcriptional repressor
MSDTMWRRLLAALARSGGMHTGPPAHDPGARGRRLLAALAGSTLAFTPGHKADQHSSPNQRHQSDSGAAAPQVAEPDERQQLDTGSAAPQASESDSPTLPHPTTPSTRERTDFEMSLRAIPEAAVARLAVYLRVLFGMKEQGIGTVSSEELSVAAGVNSAKLRKDLSYIGTYGTRGVGYEVEVLIDQIERVLGLTREQSVAVVGIGNLGHALANYGGFPGRGFPVTALFDVDPDLMGVPVGGIPVNHIDDIPSVCVAKEITIGVIATPPAAAQTVCDRLVAAGVKHILNFAPVVLQVPETVEVRKVDLAVELLILSLRQTSPSEAPSHPKATGPLGSPSTRSPDTTDRSLTGPPDIGADSHRR